MLGFFDANNVNWEQVAIFIFGAAFAVLVIILGIFFPAPQLFQSDVFKIVLALAASAFAGAVGILVSSDGFSARF